MPIETLLLGAVFVATMSFTPGPANLSLLSVGASLGLSRALPYLFGVWLGGLFVITAGALGLGALLMTLPEVFFALKLMGFAYICWLAWRLARAGFGGPSHEVAPSFWAGVALHPVNPKAYVQTVMVFTAFIVPDISYAPQALALVAVSMVLMMMATSLWGMGGNAIRLFVRDQRVMRGIAIAASAFMVVSVAAALAV
ncbi:Lysine exporter protein (LYSE/YGGA) [Parvibaculum lavamentivorans DS-1]|uniref:Lysine exporter protein (LYSE/YGGA) n=1 Tax=Parvibaculum lavamentivorans (strain DS-1 / DSM 13023 / NCIMB 13966) TaxID=402881 RepID=A7HV16_PARL1|nr:LysE family translocator [Parvibaculum lavamentivorans]ABS63749.1 Lysine exporter protein (LYSE/YGGA) [Parvibaculum lavamentivorans DS-1]